MFEELNTLWRSSTIKPSFELVHVVLALFIFKENKEGIGRYRLQKELLLGSGTTKSLIIKLNETLNFITVLIDENLKKGHVLTNSGLRFVDKVKKRVPLLKAGDSSILKDIIIKSEAKFSYFCLVRDAIDRITNGIDQRDAAIKIGGMGATCLLYNGKDLIFPSHSLSQNDKGQIKVKDNIFNYINSVIQNSDSQLKENDVFIIGLGENPETARLAALNAALTIL